MICGKTDVKIPTCDDCSELEERVEALENDTCCEDTRAIVDAQGEAIGIIDNQILVIQETIEGLTGLRTEIVDELPEEGEPNVIYLIENGGDDTYSMWIYSNNEWVQVGGGEIDLTNYVTTTDLAAALADYVTSSDLITYLAGKQDILTAGTGIRLYNNVISRLPLIGEIVETGSSYAPSYYGTYTLVDKNLAPQVLSNTNVTWSSAASNRTSGIRICDKTINIRLQFDAKITDDTLRLCRIPYSALGLSDAPRQHFVGWCDGAHQIGMFGAYTDGSDIVIDAYDATPHSGYSTQTWHIQFDMAIEYSQILNSACDRFYWKRTA